MCEAERIVEEIIEKYKKLKEEGQQILADLEADPTIIQ